MKFRYLSVIFLSAFLLSGCQNPGINQDLNRPDQVPLVNEQAVNSASSSTPEVSSGQESQKQKPAEMNKEAEIPQTLDYQVLFAPQAPYGVWDDLHKEACEEASIITVVKYFNREPLAAHLMEQGILDLVKWESENGYQVDLTAVEARDILVNHFKLKAELSTEVTVDKIKRELVNGNLIIVPAAGRQLGNPYFQTPGPIYHMLVIRGYNQSEFITNDVGTKRGDGFKYKYQVLLNAVYDWNHQLAESGMTDDEIGQGQKIMIIVSK